jgi:quercetin dioxygenase-like cupin family protein
MRSENTIPQLGERTGTREEIQQECLSVPPSATSQRKLLGEDQMKSTAARSVVTSVAIILTALCGAHAQSTPSSAGDTEAAAKPLFLEKNEGELRTRRPRTDRPVAAPQFMLKVSPKNNGSQHLVLGTEELAPGAAIPKHRHLGQDEILLLQTGTAHVWLGDQEREVHAGGLVFIPTNTWISLKNTGTEPVSLTFIFSAPGFEDTMRCNSVPAGETPTPITPEQRNECSHQGHVEYEAMPDVPKAK